MKITKELIEKLKKNRVKMEIQITQRVDLDKLINKDIDSLSESDIINISEITEKEYHYWINGDYNGILNKNNNNYAMNTIDILKKLLNNVQSQINDDVKQQFEEENCFIKSDENDFIPPDDESLTYWEKELPDDTKINDEIIKDEVDNIKNLQYVTIEGEGTPSFYNDENGEPKLYEKIINLYEILNWKENDIYYAPDKSAFYKIKDNSLYQKGINDSKNNFNLIHEKYSEELFKILKNSIKQIKKIVG